MKTKVMVDFQIWISVPLSIFRDEFSDNVMHCAELILWQHWLEWIFR